MRKAIASVKIAVLATLAIAATSSASLAQAGSTGGTIGKTDKSVSSGEEAAKPQLSAPKQNQQTASPGGATRQVINLAGQWKAPYGTAEIHQQGKDLEFKNEFGMVSSGRWSDPNTVIADGYGLECKISKDAKVISWSNGAKWYR